MIQFSGPTAHSGGAAIPHCCQERACEELSVLHTITIHAPRPRHKRPPCSAHRALRRKSTEHNALPRLAAK
ncbi:Hypp4285 [Branchiostoma lanceolatum]|uniref:Hypp4285 protein n=1 Tax=Branchiostoma lanceolatum TaxID=7740 RepID=A0A8K0EXU3_BRALA|nr:Hypp4285 [Branchiostoma lanceolatum]